MLGIGSTVFVSRYYFNRATDKSLTPFIDYSAYFLKDIDAEVKKDLSIKYQGVEVDELTQMQFLIANNGERPIRDLISLLSYIYRKEPLYWTRQLCTFIRKGEMSH